MLLKSILVCVTWLQVSSKQNGCPQPYVPRWAVAIRAKYVKCSLDCAKRFFRRSAKSILVRLAEQPPKNLFSNLLKEMLAADFIVNSLETCPLEKLISNQRSPFHEII